VRCSRACKAALRGPCLNHLRLTDIVTRALPRALWPPRTGHPVFQNSLLFRDNSNGDEYPRCRAARARHLGTRTPPPRCMPPRGFRLRGTRRRPSGQRRRCRRGDRGRSVILPFPHGGNPPPSGRCSQPSGRPGRGRQFPPAGACGLRSRTGENLLMARGIPRHSSIPVMKIIVMLNHDVDPRLARCQRDQSRPALSQAG
jgi:hypothetical protein